MEPNGHHLANTYDWGSYLVEGRAFRIIIRQPLRPHFRYSFSYFINGGLTITGFTYKILAIASYDPCAGNTD